MKLVKKGCILFVSIVLLGWMANVLAFSLPQKVIHSNIVKSADTLWKESAFFPVIGERYRNSIADNNTDAWMLLMADYDGEENIFEKSVGGYFRTYENSTISGLGGYDNFITSQKEDAKISGTSSYAVYWHGWLLILRFLLLFFSYEDIRYLSMAAISFLLFYFIYMLLKNGKKGYALATAITLLMMLPITAMISFEYAFMMYVTLISNIFLVKYSDRIKCRDEFILFFFIMGMIVSYVDFLTYPIVTLGFCMMTYLMYDEQIENVWEKVIRIIVGSIMWGIGYLGMWSTKWLIGTCILKRNVIVEGINRILVRTSSTTGNGMASAPSITYFQVLEACIGAFARKGYVVLGIFGLVCILIYYKKYVKKNLSVKQCLGLAIPCFLIFCMPFVWSFLVKNHTYTHANFTSNIFSLSYLAVASYLVMLGDRCSNKYS